MEQTSINSFADLISVFEQYKNSNSLIFRGQAESAWKLIPKSGRTEHYNSYTKSFAEKDVFESWKRYASHFLNKEPLNDWDWLALAQHHGLATRLLDWTKNPLTAAFFAVFELNESDSSIYIYKIKSGMNPTIEDPYQFSGFSVFFPKGLSARILSQRGVFTISGTPNVPLEETLKEDLHKIIIPKKAKGEILTSLDFYGVNQLSIFQDLDSLSDHLNGYVLKIGKGNHKPFNNDILINNELTMG